MDDGSGPGWGGERERDGEGERTGKGMSRYLGFFGPWAAGSRITKLLAYQSAGLLATGCRTGPDQAAE
jgi:hypothetical protein